MWACHSKSDIAIKHTKPLFWLMLVLLMISSSGCHKLNVGGIKDRFTPSNDRDWRPELATIPYAEIEGPQYTLRNIRNCKYATSDDYVVDYYDREISIDQIQTVDFLVVPFKLTPRLAHTMMSFGLDDGTYIAVSVEVRKERNEKYNALLGAGPEFELIYVIGDERDVIQLRTHHRKSDVYIYPTVATPKQSRALFANVIQRVNKLAVEPEFYNSITNNCTTNLAGHVNEIIPDKITYGWKVLLPGLSAQYAYELGLLDNRIPFEDLEQLALVDQSLDSGLDDQNYSRLIRQGHDRIQRYLHRQKAREARLSGRGDELL